MEQSMNDSKNWRVALERPCECDPPGPDAWKTFGPACTKCQGTKIERQLVSLRELADLLFPNHILREGMESLTTDPIHELARSHAKIDPEFGSRKT
jgi:hypothetical protein